MGNKPAGGATPAAGAGNPTKGLSDEIHKY
jgi:hypothetical protein